MGHVLPGCIVLFVAVFCFHCCSLILVEKKVAYTWIHKDKKALSTWSHAHRVVKFEYLTWKRAQRNKLNPKQNFPFKRMCGTL
jgi:hypothetical protein